MDDITTDDMRLPAQHIDLNSLLIDNPIATFFVRVSGSSMIDAAIFDNDILIINRALHARDGDFVIAALNGEFTVKELRLSPLQLIPHNKTMKPIDINGEDQFELFGVVTGVVRQMRRTTP